MLSQCFCWGFHSMRLQKVGHYFLLTLSVNKMFIIVTDVWTLLGWHIVSGVISLWGAIAATPGVMVGGMSTPLCKHSYKTKQSPPALACVYQWCPARFLAMKYLVLTPYLCTYNLQKANGLRLSTILYWYLVFSSAGTLQQLVFVLMRVRRQGSILLPCSVSDGKKRSQVTRPCLWKIRIWLWVGP